MTSFATLRSVLRAFGRPDKGHLNVPDLELLDLVGRYLTLRVQTAAAAHDLIPIEEVKLSEVEQVAQTARDLLGLTYEMNEIGKWRTVYGVTVDDVIEYYAVKRLRLLGWSWKQIADSVGASPSWLFKRFRDAEKHWQAELREITQPTGHSEG